MLPVWHDGDPIVRSPTKRAGIADPTHFAIRPTPGRLLSDAISEEARSPSLGQIEEAKAAQEEAEAELLKFETLEVRDKTNDRLAEAVARA